MREYTIKDRQECKERVRGEEKKKKACEIIAGQWLTEDLAHLSGRTSIPRIGFRSIESLAMIDDYRLNYRPFHPYLRSSEIISRCNPFVLFTNPARYSV